MPFKPFMWVSNLCLILALISVSAQADVYGRVVAVTDGDTIKVLDATNTQHRVRLTGIDAPERNQGFGNVSRKYLADIVAGKLVYVQSHKKDYYGRILGKVWVQPEGCLDCEFTVDANLAVLDAGLAWWYRKYAREQSPEDQTAYEEAETRSQQAKRGLWSDSQAVPPWDWRRKR